MPTKAWAYYSSAADDEITHRENHLAYHRIWFRPRVLRDMTKVDCNTTILGQKSSMPIYVVCICGIRDWGRLLTSIRAADRHRFRKIGASGGRIEFNKGCREEGHYPNGKALFVPLSHHGIHYVFLTFNRLHHPQIPTLASRSFDEMVDAAIPGQTQFLQLYVNRDREITKRIVQHAEERGIKGLFLTVDAPQLGRREKDMRTKFEDEGTHLQKSRKDQLDRSQGAAKAITVGLMERSSCVMANLWAPFFRRPSLTQVFHGRT
jgi:L-lactate dehydrogenase (cytochrome)